MNGPQSQLLPLYSKWTGGPNCQLIENNSAQVFIIQTTNYWVGSYSVNEIIVGCIALGDSTPLIREPKWVMGCWSLKWDPFHLKFIGSAIDKTKELLIVLSTPDNSSLVNGAEPVRGYNIDAVLLTSSMSHNMASLQPPTSYPLWQPSCLLP